MYLIIALIAILACLHLIKQTLSLYKYKDFPGPSPLLSLPLIGHGYLLGPNVAKGLMDAQKKHGDIFRFDLGGVPTVHFCTQEIAFKAFKLDAFNGKGSQRVMDAAAKKDKHGEYVYGISRASHDQWAEQRKFMMKTLVDLTAGDKKNMEDIISQEAEDLATMFIKRSNRTFRSNAADIFPKAVSNVIWRITVGQQVDDTHVNDIVAAVTSVFSILTSNIPVNLLQKNSVWVTKLLKWMGRPNFFDSWKSLWNLSAKMVEPFGPDSQGNYFEQGLDYCQKSTDNKFLNPTSGHLYMEASAMIFFLAGTDTSANVLMWTMLYMIKYPEMQDKMYKEIFRITGGNNRKVLLEDQSKAHFVNAFLTEVVRHSPSRVLFPNHETSEDVVFEGKFFPKGTQVFATAFCINHDRRVFSDPENFRPDRFLDSKSEFVSDSSIVLFGLGKRRCPGEIMARAETFIILSTLVQRCKFEAVPGDKLDITYSGTHNPKPFRFRATSREEAFH